MKEPGSWAKERKHGTKCTAMGKDKDGLWACRRPRSRRQLCEGHFKMYYVKKRPLARLAPRRPQNMTLDEVAAWVLTNTKRQKPPKYLDTPCRVWKGALNAGGYGEVAHKGKSYGAHRLAHYHATGELPGRESGLQINHHCDVPACCEPKHLYAGTAAENADDMARRERATKRNYGREPPGNPQPLRPKDRKRLERKKWCGWI